jgi:hypothetical protein
MKAWGAAVLVALMAVPASAGAKPGFSVQRPQRWSEFSVRGANGYRVRVSATKAEPKAPGNLYVSASKGSATVQYSTRGVIRKDGAIDVRLPGVGRIAVHFHATRVTREAVADNCKGRASVIRHGVFRGTIRLRGEGGYTSVHRRSAKGKVTQSFRQVCDQREHGSEGGGSGGSFHQSFLFAGLQGQRSIDFMASKVDFGPKFGGSMVFFTASSGARHDGLFVNSLVSAQGKASEFSTPDSPGVLGDATVEPPSPFQGSATFHLDSPTSSSWTGTLGVELPGIGKVALAGSGFWSALCEDAACTKTLPPNVGIFTFGSSGR